MLIWFEFASNDCLHFDFGAKSAKNEIQIFSSNRNTIARLRDFRKIVAIKSKQKLQNSEFFCEIVGGQEK